MVEPSESTNIKRIKYKKKQVNREREKVEEDNDSATTVREDLLDDGLHSRDAAAPSSSSATGSPRIGVCSTRTEGLRGGGHKGDYPGCK